MRVHLMTVVSAAAFALALGVAPVYAGATSNEGGPGVSGGPPASPGGVVPVKQREGSGLEGSGAERQGMGRDAGEPRAKRGAPGGPGGLAEPRGRDKPISAEREQKGKRAAERTREDKPTGKRAQKEDEPTAKRAQKQDRMQKQDRAQKQDQKRPTKEARDAGDSAKSGADKSGRDRDRRDQKGATAKIDSGEKQKVRNYFSDNKPKVKRVERSAVSVSIGIGIPGSIALYPLPADIVVAAADCPIEYFVWADDLVLVDSCTREVIDIIPGVA
jgi:Protein of unknown function (DUF1236)